MNVSSILRLSKPEIKVLLCEQKWSKNASLIVLYLSNRSIIVYIEDNSREPLVCQRRWMEDEDICAMTINRDNEIIIATQSSIIITTFSFLVSSKNSEHLHQLFQEAFKNRNEEKLKEGGHLVQIYQTIPKKRSFFSKDPVYPIKGKATPLSQLQAELRPQVLHLVEEKQFSFLLIVSDKYVVCWDLNQMAFIRYPSGYLIPTQRSGIVYLSIWRFPKVFMVFGSMGHRVSGSWASE